MHQLTLVLLALAVRHILAEEEADRGFHVLDDAHKYITRPDIEAPRFNVTVYERQQVSPGYWFIPSYDFLDQSIQNGGRWTAPHIFDSYGELIWSGSYLSRQYDAFDFRLSKVMGEDMLSFLYPRNRSAVLLDLSYNIRHTVPVAEERETVDMHEFHLVDNGTKALFFYDRRRNMTLQQSRAIGYMNGNCTVNDNLFHELDVADGFKPTFTWSSADHVGLYESSEVGTSLKDRCSTFWDFIHVNSLDKFPDGSYLMSSRHTDTIYKIAPDGDIVWRLGGVEDDFRSDFQFARQHNARIVSSNETHTILSFFDNATRTPMREATADSSRGMPVELHTSRQPMLARLIREFPHPDGPDNYCVARANVQVLPNGNVWICWVDGLLSTEYTPDGALILKARVQQDWLKSYRTYKFSFVGSPTAPPDVHSEAIGSDEANTTTTLVHVSWNGATEVATWNLYKTDDIGNIDSPTPVAQLPRTGFETALTYKGFASHVVVEALDVHGAVLGQSDVIKTIVSAQLSTMTIARESEWLGRMNQRIELTRQAIWVMHEIYVNPTAAFACGLVCGMALLVGSRAVWRAKRKGALFRRRNDSVYKRLSQCEDEKM